MIDWTYWASQEMVTYGEACMLSLGIDPSAIKGNALPRKLEAKLKRREAVAKSQLGRDLPSRETNADLSSGSGETTGVTLPGFRRWAEALPEPFTLPEEFPKETTPESFSPATGQPAQVQALREAQWLHWAKKDLWSEAEFAALCCGLVPDEIGGTVDPGKVSGDHSQPIAINRAANDIRRGTLSGTLAFVPRDDADTAARMYGTARHYEPALAAAWAATRFDTFPASLLCAVKQRAQASEVATHAFLEPAQCKSLTNRERNNLLRIIRALDSMNPKPLPLTGYAESVRAKLAELGLREVSDDTIRKVVGDARNLDS